MLSDRLRATTLADSALPPLVDLSTGKDANLFRLS